jgi:HEAT repeat protein
MASLERRISQAELRRALRDPSSLVRLTAAKVVAGLSRRRHMASEGLVMLIREHLHRERDSLVRAEILEAVYRTLQRSQDLNDLLRLLGSRRGIVRWRAIEGVAKVLTSRTAATIQTPLSMASRVEVQPRLRKRMREVLSIAKGKRPSGNPPTDR